MLQMSYFLKGFFLTVALSAAAFLFVPQIVLAEACFSYSAQKCQEGSKAVPDGPSVTACPGKNDVFKGCSKNSENGTPDPVLCCMSPAETGVSSKSQCGPKSTPLGEYVCMLKQACAKNGKPFNADANKGDAVCNQTGEICCQVKQASAASAAPAAKKVSGKVMNIYNPLGPELSITAIIGKVIRTFLGIVGSIALLVFIYGGVMWMTARGNTKQAESARGALVNGAIGLVIIVMSYTLADNLVRMLTTYQPPPPKPLASEEATQAETEKAQEQTSLSEQKAKEEQAKQEGAQQQSSKPKCPEGYTCQSTNGMLLEYMQNYCQQTASGDSEECGAAALCCSSKK